MASILSLGLVSFWSFRQIYVVFPIACPQAQESISTCWETAKCPPPFSCLMRLAPHSDNVARLVTACCCLIIAILCCKWSLKVIKGFVSCDLWAFLLQGSQAVTNAPLVQLSIISWKVPCSNYWRPQYSTWKTLLQASAITQAWQGCPRPKSHRVRVDKHTFPDFWASTFHPYFILTLAVYFRHIS